MSRPFLGGDRKLSQARRVQIRWYKKNLCTTCGKPAVIKMYCLRHKIYQNKWSLGYYYKQGKYMAQQRHAISREWMK